MEMKLSVLAFALFVDHIKHSAGFTSSASYSVSARNGYFWTLQATANRRSALASVLATLTLAPTAALAKDELFRPNPLTNSVLEQIRIWDQDFADNVKYNGELEKGDAGNKGKVEAYPQLLVPIVEMSNDINKINELIVIGNSKESYQTAREILSNPKYEKIAFKKMFNAYGDNIYYSDPDRANVYLGGGAIPKTNQTLAYLLRNDLLNNIENLQAELDYLIKTPSESNEDLLGYAKACKTAMDKYLTLAPPNEMKQALEIIGSM